MLRFITALAAIVISLMALVSVLVNAASCTYGVDVSYGVSESDFRCLKGQGIEFAIVRGYQSFGRADPAAPGTLSAARAAGMEGVDIYVFPCKSVSPSRIISEVLANTPRGTFGKIWMDIESNPSGGCGWGGDHSANCQYVGELIDAARSAGLNVGVYSSVGEWETVVGSSCSIGAQKGVPIWYARYNGIKDYADWIPFGGWSSSSIAIHQYADTIGGLCGVSADANCIQGGGPAPGPGPNPNPPPPPPPGPSPSSGCYQFWSGLCPGSSNCQCTTGAACLTKDAYKSYNRSLLKNEVGGCAGRCMNVIHGECPGNAECMKASSYC